MSDQYLRHQSLPIFETEAVYLQTRIYFQLLKRLKEKKKPTQQTFFRKFVSTKFRTLYITGIHYVFVELNKLMFSTSNLRDF